MDGQSGSPPGDSDGNQETRGLRNAAIIVVGGSFLTLRGLEAGGKRAIKAARAAIRKKSTPCATKGQLFTVVSDGEDGSGLKLHAGDQYRVLECDADSILIEVLNNLNNPYFVSREFLATIFDFPVEDVAKGE